MSTSHLEQRDLIKLNLEGIKNLKKMISNLEMKISFLEQDNEELLKEIVLFGGNHEETF